MNKLFDYLHLRDCGGLELLFAMLPMLSGYSYPGLPFSVLIPVLLIILSFKREKPLLTHSHSCIIILLVYIIVHEILLGLFSVGLGASFINNTLQSIFCLSAAIIVGPKIVFSKMLGAINWVALVSMGGMVYHFVLFLNGSSFTPIALPFLPDMDPSSRIFILVDRPSSFYMEPQAYVSFMMVPLFLALYERKYIWSGIIILTLFMSSSTTGLLLVFLMSVFFVLTHGVKKKMRIMSLGLIVIMAIVLTQTSIFGQAVDKLTSTDVETNVRLSQGPSIVKSMKSEYFLFGAPFSSAYDYCVNMCASLDIIYYGTGVFVATFWLLILRYGIAGLLLYVNVYIKFWKSTRLLFPYIFCLIVTMFSNRDFFGAFFCFQMIFIVVFDNYKNNKIAYEGSTYRVGAR